MNTDNLAERILAGDRRALARGITLVESSRSDHKVEAQALLAELMPRTGGAMRLGLSGAPGVGKSTFTEALGKHLTGLDTRLLSWRLIQAPRDQAGRFWETKPGWKNSPETATPLFGRAQPVVRLVVWRAELAKPCC